MVKGIVYSVISRLNMFSSSDQKNDVSPKVKSDYNRDVWALSFDDYIQALDWFTRKVVEEFGDGGTAPTQSSED